MESTALAQLSHLISLAGTWLWSLLTMLLSAFFLVGSLFCLSAAIVQAWLELRHQRSYQMPPPRPDLLPLGKPYMQSISVRLTNRLRWRFPRRSHHCQ